MKSYPAAPLENTKKTVANAFRLAREEIVFLVIGRLSKEISHAINEISYNTSPKWFSTNSSKIHNMVDCRLHI